MSSCDFFRYMKQRHAYIVILNILFKITKWQGGHILKKDIQIGALDANPHSKRRVKHLVEISLSRAIRQAT